MNIANTIESIVEVGLFIWGKVCIRHFIWVFTIVILINLINSCIIYTNINNSLKQFINSTVGKSTMRLHQVVAWLDSSVDGVHIGERPLHRAFVIYCFQLFGVPTVLTVPCVIWVGDYPRYYLMILNSSCPYLSSFIAKLQVEATFLRPSQLLLLVLPTSVYLQLQHQPSSV